MLSAVDGVYEKNETFRALAAAKGEVEEKEMLLRDFFWFVFETSEAKKKKIERKGKIERETARARAFPTTF